MDRPAIKAITRGFLTLSPCIPAPILNDKGQRHTSPAGRVGGVANSRVRSATPKHPLPGKPGGSILAVYLESSPYDKENLPISVFRGKDVLNTGSMHLEYRQALFVACWPRAPSAEGKSEDVKMPMALTLEHNFACLKNFAYLFSLRFA